MIKKLILSTLIISTLAFADEVVVNEQYGDSGKKFYEETNRGWHSYEDLPVEVIKKLEEMEKKIAKLEAKKKAEKPKPLGAKWFRTNLQSYRDKAIDEPTEQNILTIKLMEKVMGEKAYNYAIKSSIVSIKYPIFNATMATGNTSSLNDDFYKGRARKELFKSLAKDKGLWFFYEKDCPKCEDMSGVVRGVADDFGWSVLPISIDGGAMPNGAFPKFVNDTGHAKELGVLTTPAIYLIDPKTLEVSNITQNYILRDDLIHRVVEMSHDMGWISEEDYNMTTKADEKFRMSSQEINEIDLSDTDNLNGALIELLTNKGGF